MKPEGKTDIVFIFNVKDERTQTDGNRVLTLMKKIASNMSQSGVYSSDDVKISVSYGNTITNGDANKQKVVQRIERVSLLDTRGRLASVLPLALSKLRTVAETNGKNIILFTDSPTFWNGVTNYDRFIKDLETENIKFIPTVFSKKALGEEEDDDGDKNKQAVKPPKIHTDSPFVDSITVYDGKQPDISKLLTTPLVKPRQLTDSGEGM